MKCLVTPLACLLPLTACVEQEREMAAPGAVQAPGAYVSALAGEGRSAVVFDNGDVILADSPRLVFEKVPGRICALMACARRARSPTGR